MVKKSYIWQKPMFIMDILTKYVKIMRRKWLMRSMICNQITIPKKFDMMMYLERTSLWYDSFQLKLDFPKIIFFIFSNFFLSSSHSSHNHHFCFLQGELMHVRWLLSLKVRLRWGSERVNSVISTYSTINNYWIDNIHTDVMYSLNSVS